MDPLRGRLLLLRLLMLGGWGRRLVLVGVVLLRGRRSGCCTRHGDEVGE